MKLATLNDGSRDGQLVVVSRDLCTAHYATGIADHLQQVLDDWNFMSPQLQDLYDALNHGKARHAFPFDPQLCLAPLPRAHLLAVADAYAAAQAPESSELAATLRLGFADELAGPCAPLRAASAALQLDVEAALAVVTGDVPAGASAEQALEGVRLLMLASHVQLRALQGASDRPLVSSPSTAFSPVAVTPDELVYGGESAWAQGRLGLMLQCTLNGRKLGLCDTGQDMAWHFGQLIAALCQTRRLRAGAIVSSGEVRNRDSVRGYCSLASRRASELAQDGQAKTPWLAPGDSVRVEIKGRDGQSVFGAIDQDVQVGAQPTPVAV
ncbi:fumarylacetoacetate hydrolase family protein [Rhodoferax sp.]|uniref:fumarylacetoacetate hydrolase family protein n=1 Tax=Rhodoferax sp. TaxID=50421 RepID=UPI00260A4C16|nr:fumarylacetoacetate hydrolase family protein [Rhodoferax sp.]MDD2925991.1 fumarylacetoacetate hydrolase family protein [Rhodoferax sp.]